MTHPRILATLLSALLTVPAGMVAAQNLTPLEVVASTAANGLEGLDVAADGSLYVTNASAHVVHKIARDGSVTDFAKLDVVPQVILLTPTGYVLTAQHGEPDFAALRAPPAAATPGAAPAAPARRGMSAEMMGKLGAVVVILDHDGKVVKTIDGQPGAFFNGLDRFGKDYLISDSTAGTIWLLNTRKGTIEPWLKDDALLGPDGRFPGGNGLKVVNGNVYIANTVGGVIYRVGSSNGKPKGSLTAVAHFAAPDDFAVAKDGTIYAPSEGKVLKIAPSGEVTTIADGCTGCDAALLTNHGKTVLLVTHGFGANAGPGRVYRLKLS